MERRRGVPPRKGAPGARLWECGAPGPSEAPGAAPLCALRLRSSGIYNMLLEQAGLDLGPSVRDICAANRSDEEQQIKALLESVGSSFCPDTVDWFGKGSSDSNSRNADKSVLTKFLQAQPADFVTTKLQEMIRLMKERRFPAAFKCYFNMHKLDAISNDELYYKMVIHVHSDSVFRRYQKEMRNNPRLWPLYRGFFVDINLFKAKKERAAEIMKNANGSLEHGDGSNAISDANALADEDANLMIKLKFLTYKLRTFLIRNSLPILFKEGPAAYKVYYMRAVYIRRKCGNKQLRSDIYLTEAEPFLQQYAKRSAANQVLIGSAESSVSSEDFLATVGGLDEEGDVQRESKVASPSSPIPTTKDTITKDEGLIVFFPGIPGCAKSALCKELLNHPDGIGDDRPIQTLMGDLIKGKYWQKIAEERRKKPYSIMLADKNAPNEEVWRLIEDMCRKTKSSAVPVVPESEGTGSNPFSLDALAIFMFRVLQRVNHPGNLDKSSSNAGYNRREFEGELIDRFGSLVKMPLLRSNRNPLPDVVKSVLEEGINLYGLHTNRHGRLDSTKGAYAKEWAKWEKKVRETLSDHAGYLNGIQVPFEVAVSKVLEQLKSISKGDYLAPSTERRKGGSIVYAAATLPIDEILSAFSSIQGSNSKAEAFLKDKKLHETLKNAHVTLAHKGSHGVTAVAKYGQFVNQKVPVELTALLFSEKTAAIEARLGSVEGQKVESKNEWPHVTVWTDVGVAAKEANNLPHLHSQGNATRVEIDPPIVIEGEVDLF
ncbi:hypothetical protein V2J09_016633 [Rumex salicifolius]